MGRPRLNLTGQVFGMLTVEDCIGTARDKHSLWSCRCRCGNYSLVASNHLKCGKVKSCGCWKQQCSVTHGLTRNRVTNPVFRAWSGIISRCYNKNNKSYKYYGQRGISVCENFKHSACNLYNIIGERPSKTHSIDRINNDGPYSCGFCSECVSKTWSLNVRWATKSQQAFNRRKKGTCFPIS